MTHCCTTMANHLMTGEVGIQHSDQHGYGIAYREGTGGGMQQIYFCPWCAMDLGSCTECGHWNGHHWVDADGWHRCGHTNDKGHGCDCGSNIGR